MPEVCHDVAIKPVLQPLSGESLRFAMANVEDEARLDVSVRGFGKTIIKKIFFDVRVFNPMSSSYHTTAVSSLYRHFECAKQRMYEQHVREV